MSEYGIVPALLLDKNKYIDIMRFPSTPNKGGSMYWYIVLNGKKLPTPYDTMKQLDEAIDELRARLCAPIISWVYE